MPRKSDEPLQVFNLSLDEFQWNVPATKIVSSILKDYTKQGKVELGINYELTCQFVDLRVPKLEEKISFIKDRSFLQHKMDTPDFKLSDLDFTQYINKIAQCNLCDLEEETLIRDLINSMWRET